MYNLELERECASVFLSELSGNAGGTGFAGG
jgi:hypothetical protein